MPYKGMRHLISLFRMAPRIPDQLSKLILKKRDKLRSISILNSCVRHKLFFNFVELADLTPIGILHQSTIGLTRDTCLMMMFDVQKSLLKRWVRKRNTVHEIHLNLVRSLLSMDDGFVNRNLEGHRLLHRHYNMLHHFERHLLNLGNVHVLLDRVRH